MADGAGEWAAIDPQARARGDEARWQAEEGLRHRVQVLLARLGERGYTAAQAEERVRAVVEETIAGMER